MHTTQQQLRARHGIVFIQITCRRRYGVAPELPLACAVLLRGGRAKSVSFVAAYERINTAVFMNVLPTLPSFCDGLHRGYRELENSSPKEVKAWRERASGVR